MVAVARTPFAARFGRLNGERTIDLAQTLIEDGPSLGVDLQRSCPKPRTTLRATRPQDGKRTATSARP